MTIKDPFTVKGKSFLPKKFDEHCVCLYVRAKHQNQMRPVQFTGDESLLPCVQNLQPVQGREKEKEAPHFPFYEMTVAHARRLVVAR